MFPLRATRAFNFGKVFRNSLSQRAFSSTADKTVTFELPKDLTRGTITKMIPLKFWVGVDDTVAHVRTEAGVKIDLKSPYSGMISKHHQKVGDTISLGDPISAIAWREGHTVISSAFLKRFNSHKRWWQWKQWGQVMFPMYEAIAYGLGFVIAVGNFGIGADLYEMDTPMQIYAILVFSVAKGALYGAVWPILVPYTVLKTYLEGDRFVHIPSRERVNIGGWRHHFVPLFSGYEYRK